MEECHRRGCGGHVWIWTTAKNRMIVDCHTHVWQTPEQLGLAELGEKTRPGGPKKSRISTPRSPWRNTPAADPDFHWQESVTVDKSIVLGFKSRYMQAEIPNRLIADYVARFPQKLVGFAGIDPTEEGAVEEVAIVQGELHLRGITISPANQDFHPTDTRAMDVYAEAERLGMPILVHPRRPIHGTEQTRICSAVSLG